MLETLIVIFGLSLFEIISSVDNAIINAHVLKTMPEKYRKIFMFWGILFAVFVVRGLLPFIIIWLANPSLSLAQAFMFLFKSDPTVAGYVEHSKPFLLLGGGVYLVFVALQWLFLEEKKYAFLVESFVHRHGFWFYAVASFLLTALVYLSVQRTPMLALSAAIGASAFFLTDGFKKKCRKRRKKA